MKYSLDIFNFLEEISSLSHSIVFLSLFALITEEGFLISPLYFLELCIQMGMSFPIESESHLVVSSFVQPHGLYSPLNSPGQNTEWVDFSVSRGSSQPRDRTQVSCIAGEFFTSWATREAQRKGNKVTRKLPTAKIFCSIYFNGRKNNFYFLLVPCGLWDLSFPSKDWTWAPCKGSTKT